MGRDEALAEIVRRDRIQLHALELEQQQPSPRRRARFATHRIVPVPRELHERGGATRWKCVGCNETFGFEDEVEDTCCPALEMFA